LNQRSEAARERQADPERVMTFTDGVFAIILTILVLEIDVPSNLSEQSLREALDELGPTLIAWVISFMITGMYWVWHRDLFNKIQWVNRDVVWLNLIFMLPAALIPFASSVLGEYYDEPIALHIYGAVLIAVSVVRVIFYQYVVSRPKLLWEPLDKKVRRLGLFLSSFPIAVYVLAMLLAGVAPSASLALYFLVPLLYFVLVTILRDRPATEEEAESFS
jgi:uncharacterized membrane protein